MVTADAAYSGPRSMAQVAAREMFEAELALHDARQSRVDSWIRAASDHLHDAIERHTAALRAIGVGLSNAS
jgi:hypothetical protein